MRYCRLGNEHVIPFEKFQKIKESIAELFCKHPPSLVNLYRTSLQFLYDAVKNPDIKIDWSHPIEVSCLKDKWLINNDCTIDPDVSHVVNYLICLDDNGKFQLSDKPLFEVDLP